MSNNIFNKFSKNMKKLGENKFVELSTVLNPLFFKKYTRFKNLNEFMDASGFKVETFEDFKAIPDDDFDNFVIDNTPFSSWRDMQIQAFELYTYQQLTKGIK